MSVGEAESEFEVLLVVFQGWALLGPVVWCGVMVTEEAAEQNACT